MGPGRRESRQSAARTAPGLRSDGSNSTQCANARAPLPGTPLSGFADQISLPAASNPLQRRVSLHLSEHSSSSRTSSYSSAGSAAELAFSPSTSYSPELSSIAASPACYPASKLVIQSDDRSGEDMRPGAGNSLADQLGSADAISKARNGDASGSPSLPCLATGPRFRGGDGEGSAYAAGPSQIGSVAGNRAAKVSVQSTSIDDTALPRKPPRQSPSTSQQDRKRAYDSALWHDDLLGPVVPGKQQQTSVSAPAVSRPLPAIMSTSSFGQTFEAGASHAPQPASYQQVALARSDSANVEPHNDSELTRNPVATASASRASSGLHLVGLSGEPRSLAVTFSPLSPHVEPFAPSRPRAMTTTVNTSAPETALEGAISHVSSLCLASQLRSAD